MVEVIMESYKGAGLDDPATLSKPNMRVRKQEEHTIVISKIG
jgi:hypothetical protein